MAAAVHGARRLPSDVMGALIVRIAREERRLAVAQGMRDGLARVGK